MVNLGLRFGQGLGSRSRLELEMGLELGLGSGLGQKFANCAYVISKLRST